MIQITITSTDTRHMKGVGKTSGKPYDFHIQTGYAHTVAEDGTVAPFPDKFEFTIAKDAQPYPRGQYALTPASLIVTRNGALEVGQLNLKPIAAK